MDMLCESEMKIGLIGSMYFIGVVISTIIAPPLGDSYGRKWVVFVSNTLRVIGLVVIVATTSLYVVYVGEILVGGSYAGLAIIGFTYVLEF